MNEFRAYYELCCKNSISHHGIQGQKWGTRNGPPYPLKSGEHSPVEKTGIGHNAANKLLSKYGSKSTAGMGEVLVAQLTAYAVMMITVKAIVEASYAHDKKKNTKENTSDIQKRIKGKHSTADDLKAVNPDFTDPTDMSARMNCTMCSTAYDLRRRGYDVVANKTEQGRKFKDAAAWYNISHKDVPKYKTRDQFEAALQNEPDGARGLTFTSYGMFNSYHCMVWEKKNGVVTISDGQNNTPPKSIKESGISAKGSVPYQYLRTDNAEINWDLIRDAVKERT